MIEKDSGREASKDLRKEKLKSGKEMKRLVVFFVESVIILAIISGGVVPMNAFSFLFKQIPE